MSHGLMVGPRVVGPAGALGSVVTGSGDGEADSGITVEACGAGVGGVTGGATCGAGVGGATGGVTGGDVVGSGPVGGGDGGKLPSRVC
jgi:hypothetical protein